jgi:hypothetical protein
MGEKAAPADSSIELPRLNSPREDLGQDALPSPIQADASKPSNTALPSHGVDGDFSPAIANAPQIPDQTYFEQIASTVSSPTCSALVLRRPWESGSIT